MIQSITIEYKNNVVPNTTIKCILYSLYLSVSISRLRYPVLKQEIDYVHLHIWFNYKITF